VNPDGTRCSSAVAFLRPVLARDNLRVETFAQVSRIEIAGGRANGVEYTKDGETRQASVGKEVLLCAGAIDSPRLLMLSGIGPADHLRSHGIEVLVDLPGVGQNLQDHLLLAVAFRSRRQTVGGSAIIGEAGLFTRAADRFAAA